jgi:hypothetical protein
VRLDRIQTIKSNDFSLLHGVASRLNASFIEKILFEIAPFIIRRSLSPRARLDLSTAATTLVYL